MENNDLYELQRMAELEATELPEPQEPQKPQKEHVEQPRWKSWPVWLSVLGALWVIANAFGLTERWGIEESIFKKVVDAIGVILTGFGILNNPTDRANF